MVNEQKQPGILLRHIVLREAHFRHNDAFDPTPPRVGGEMSVVVAFLGQPERPEGVSLTVQSVETDLRHPYFLTVEMVGLLGVDSDAPNMKLEEYLETNGVALLFPFVREVIANLTMRGQFGPLLLNPTNIKALGSNPADVL